MDIWPVKDVAVMFTCQSNDPSEFSTDIIIWLDLIAICTILVDVFLLELSIFNLISFNIMVGFKARVMPSAYFIKLGSLIHWGGILWVGRVCMWGGGYICVYGWGVLEGCECIGKRRGRKETTSFYHVCYIKFISSWKNSIPSTW